MTYSDSTPRDEYTGNGSTKIFAYTYRILADTDLKVYLVDANNVETLQTITTHYTVSGAGDAGGGNVTMVTAPAATERLIIEREIPFAQATDYVENDDFPAETHETALDKITMLAQQNQRDITRSLRHAKGTADSVSTELPAPSAGQFIAWNAGATALINSAGATSGVTVSTFMATVLDDTTAAAALTTLGIGTTDTPQFTGIELGHATDTTLARASAGDVNIEGNIIYRAGGTDVPVADGGTGASSFTDGGVLLGSGTGPITAMAVLADGEMIVGDGATDPVAKSGEALRLSIGVPEQATQAAIEAETNENTYAPPDLIRHSPGVAKCWAKISADGATINASYNLASHTDTGTGDGVFVIDTAFSSADYAVVLTGERGDAGKTTAGHVNAYAAGTLSYFMVDGNSSIADAVSDRIRNVAMFGDQ